MMEISLFSPLPSPRFIPAGKRLLAAFFLALVPWAISGPPPLRAEEPIYSEVPRFHPVMARNGMVVAEEALAARAGLRVLEKGGNAVDAAVTVGFVLAVTLPRAGNLGGGGFMLIHEVETGKTIALDYREKAPRRASRDMFLNEAGNPDPDKSQKSYLAAGVPGTVRGLAAALEKFGTISLGDALQPAIELAENGFPVTEELSRALKLARPEMAFSPAAMAIFYRADGASPEAGERLVQKDLARSLRRIAHKGADAFYKGAIAKRITAAMETGGGLIDAVDLATYEPVFRSPVSGAYRGYDIVSMPPPSSGGVHLIQMLNMLENYPLREFGHNSARSINIMAECMKLAYADRARHLGDPDFVDIPLQGLLSKQYAFHLTKLINPGKSLSAKEIRAGNPWPYGESNETTHFSVLDRWGNAVSNTYTLNFSFGSKKVIPGTGILMNNEMDDFSAKPGVPNAYGLIGGAANAIAPGKRMLSSMTPAMVFKDGQLTLVTGSPGGGRIITTVLQVILNGIDFEMNIAEATNAVRVHHQWLPDQLRVESGLNPDTAKLLEKMGYRLSFEDAMGATQSISRRDGFLYGASDPRRPGGLAAGY